MALGIFTCAARRVPGICSSVVNGKHETQGSDAAYQLSL